MGFIHASNMNIRVFANKLLKKNHLYADTENKLKHETISLSCNQATIDAYPFSNLLVMGHLSQHDRD